MEEYPKMLYNGRNVKVVETEADEKAAIKAGWKTADKRGHAELPEEFAPEPNPEA